MIDNDTMTKQEQELLWSRVKALDASLIADPAVTLPLYNKGESPLHVLARNGFMGVLDHPEVGTIKETYWGRTPMYYLAESVGFELRISIRNKFCGPEKLEAAKRDVLTLLRHPLANSIACEFSKDTPLHLLAQRGVTEILDHPQVATPQNLHGWTPLHCLAYFCEFPRDHVQKLLEHPEIATPKDKLGDTPLHFLASRGFAQVLEHPSVATVAGNWGSTPLHYASRRGLVEAMRHPMAPFVCDKDGDTPLAILARRGNIDAKAMLASLGAAKRTEIER